MTTTTTPALVPRVNLSALARKTEKQKPACPVLADERAAELAGLVLRLADEADVINANLEINKAELRSIAVPDFFARCTGRTDIPSSLAVPAAGGEVLVSLTSRYKQPVSPEALASVMGPAVTRWMQPSFKLEIDSAKVPQARQQEVVDALLAVLASFGCADALTAKESLAPSEDFHVARHTAFDCATNLAIEGVMPMVVAIKTKGRK